MTATLSDLKMELWLRQRENEDIIWITRDGDNIPIKNLSDKHLLRIINMLEVEERRQAQSYEALSSIGNVNI